MYLPSTLDFGISTKEIRTNGALGFYNNVQIRSSVEEDFFADMWNLLYRVVRDLGTCWYRKKKEIVVLTIYTYTIRMIGHICLLISRHGATNRSTDPHSFARGLFIFCKIGAEVFEELWNVLLEENGEGKMNRGSNSWTSSWTCRREEDTSR